MKERIFTVRQYSHQACMDFERTTFTVFTPAYNAEDTLYRVYESLLQQSFRDFEWIVVDDGSTDLTRDLVRGWAESKNTWFPIRYVYQKNDHKKSAHNRAVSLAMGKFFLPLDADDRCAHFALQEFNDVWLAIPQEIRDGFAGVCALCQHENGKIVGNSFPGTRYFDATPQELLHRYKVKGEKWGFNRTDILREFLFREDIPGYVPESLVWDAIGRRYQTRFVNETLRTYHQESQQYKNQRLVKLKRFREPGRLAHKKEKLNHDLSWFRVDPLYILKEAVWVGRFTLHVARSERGFVKLTNPKARILVGAAFPLAALIYCKDIFDARAVGNQRREDKRRIG